MSRQHQRNSDDFGHLHWARHCNNVIETLCDNPDKMWWFCYEFATVDHVKKTNNQNIFLFMCVTWYSNWSNHLVHLLNIQSDVHERPWSAHSPLVISCRTCTGQDMPLTWLCRCLKTVPTTMKRVLILCHAWTTASVDHSWETAWQLEDSTSITASTLQQ